MAFDQSAKVFSGRRAEHILKQPRADVVVEFPAIGIIDVIQQSWLAAARLSASLGSGGFLYVVIGQIGEAQRELAEVFFHWLDAARQHRKRALLDINGRIKPEAALAHKHGTRHLAVHRGGEAEAAALECECASIALEDEILNRDRLTAQRDM